MTGAAIVAGKAGGAYRLTMLSRRRRAGKTDSGEGREMGARCGLDALVPGVCAVNSNRETGLKNGLHKGLKM